MGATFAVLKDRWNDSHATEIRGEANPEAIKRAATDYVQRNAFDDDEELIIGIVRASDAGAARLKPTEANGNGGITWLYIMRNSGTIEALP